MDKSDGNEVERKCFNCNSYFPDSVDKETEFGICLNDKAFEPYLDEIFEGNFSRCQNLVVEKKFNGAEHCCEKFDPVEMLDDDFSVEEFQDQDGKFDIDKFKTHIAVAALNENIKTAPVDFLTKDLQDKSAAALRTLSFFANAGNQSAKEELLKYFRTLPCPDTLESVHHKVEVLELLQRADIDESEIYPLLIEEMKVLPSNNTTRQWNTAILNYCNRCETDKVREALKDLIHERNFSPKLRKRIEEIIEPPSRDSWW